MIVNKTILVTGAAGFIGAHLTKKLLLHNNKIHILVRNTTNLWRINNILKFIKLYTVSLENKQKISKIVKQIKPQIIFHLAAYGNYSYENNPKKIIQTNLLGTANLLWALNLLNYESFINTGSSSEYGFKSKPMKETDTLEPNSFYAAAKAASTYFCKVISRSFNKPIVTLRPFSVYGPFEEPGRFIPTAISNILSNKPIKLTTNIARRDYIYIDDVINFYIKVASKIHRNIYGETFNIGTGKQYSNEDVVKVLKKIVGGRVIIHKGGYQNRSWDSDFWVSDIARSKKIFKWKPNNNLAFGLHKTYQWFNANESYKKIYSRLS